MPLGTLQSFVQNLQQGQQASRQAFEWKQKQDALAALGRMFGQDGTPQPPTTTPPIAGGGPAGPAPPGGPMQQPDAPIKLMPQTAAQLPPQALQALSALNGQAPSQGGAPGPQGGPMPAPAPQPDPSMSATAQPQHDFGDAFGEAQHTIKAMAQSIKAANPNLDPRTLALAVSDGIENLKGVAPLTKASMTAQIQTVKLQQDWQYKQARLQQLDQGVQIKLQQAKTAEEKVQVMQEYNQQRIHIMQENVDLGYDRINSQESIAAGHDNTRLAAANIGAGSREGIAAAGNEEHDQASKDRLYGSVYASYLRNKPGDEAGAARAADAAVQGAANRRGGSAPRADRPTLAPRPGGGKSVPEGEREFLKANAKDQKVVGAYTQRYGKAAVDAAMR